MPTGALKTCRIAIIWPIDKDWPRDKVKNWIERAGGHASFKLQDDITHLVVSEKTWQQQTGAVAEALEANRNEGRSIKIVSPDWLEYCLQHQIKTKDGPYSWEKLDKASLATAAKIKRAAEKLEKQAVGPRSTQGLMKELMVASTEQYVDQREKARLDREAEELRRAQKVIVEEEARSKVMEREDGVRKRKEQEAVFRRGAKKARNEIFSENHHIYAEDTGFKYEVLLTKIDTRKNRNERCALTIYESNSSPHTYATNLHFAGTCQLPSNTILAAIGCNFLTAFRTFRKCFREQTGVEWDDRVKHAAERAGREKLARDSGEARAEAETEEAFRRKLFEYHPPRRGPQGILPEKARAVVPEVGPLPVQQVSEKSERPDVCMSGANGAGPMESPGQAATQPETQFTFEAEAGAESQMAGEAGTDSQVASATGTDFDSFISGAMEEVRNGDLVLDSSYPFDSGEFDGANNGGEAAEPGCRQASGVGDGAETETQTQQGQTQLAARVGRELLDFDTGLMPSGDGETHTASPQLGLASHLFDSDEMREEVGGALDLVF